MLGYTRAINIFQYPPQRECLPLVTGHSRRSFKIPPVQLSDRLSLMPIQQDVLMSSSILFLWLTMARSHLLHDPLVSVFPPWVDTMQPTSRDAGRYRPLDPVTASSKQGIKQLTHRRADLVTISNTLSSLGQVSANNSSVTRLSCHDTLSKDSPRIITANPTAESCDNSSWKTPSASRFSLSPSTWLKAGSRLQFDYLASLSRPIPTLSLNHPLLSEG